LLPRTHGWVEKQKFDSHIRNRHYLECVVMIQFVTMYQCFSSQATVCPDQTAIFLAPIITDIIRNTKRELYDEKLEGALEILDLE